MDQDVTWYWGRPRLRPHCVRWGLSSLPPKGAPQPHFSAHVYCGRTAGWIRVPLGTEVGLNPGDVVLDCDPAPHVRGLSSLPPLFGPLCSGMVAHISTLLLSTCFSKPTQSELLRCRIYTVSQKTSHRWLAITLRHMNGFWYFLAEMLPIKSAIKRRCTMPPQVNRASALPVKTRKHENHIFTQLDCVTQTMHRALSSWNKKLSSVMCLIVSNICWDSKIT